MADDPLDAQIIEEDAATIAREYVTRWEELSPYLGLRSQEEEAIRGTFRNYDDQRREALKKWRARKGKSATYRAFMDAANRAGNADLADNVEEFVRTKPPPSPAVSPPVTHLPPPSSPSSVRELSKHAVQINTFPRHRYLPKQAEICVLFLWAYGSHEPLLL